ncbi:MAG: DNA-processing protein DprA, partial [Candidatus Berkelbacteria bacterium]|nr:DNA-processing protein DprA [Candidatus Berkelbacteria bacterium]
MTEDKKYWLALNSCPEIGAANLYKLANHFSSMKKAWQAGIELKNAGIKNDIILAIKKARNEINPDEEWKRIEKERIGIITFKENNFPEQLREIPDPPAMLYIKGELKTGDEIAVAIVGTRRMSQYGRQVTEEITSTIAVAGVTVVSGLARGVDAVAHQTALEAGSRTIAILGCGLDEDSIYPPENKILAQKIIKGRGAVISEFHLGTPPLKHHFPMRNRIISGLSVAVLVTECPIPSGALITARTALEQGRD